MKTRLFTSLLAICLVALFLSPIFAASIEKDEVEYQSQTFKHWWGIDLEWRFDELPTKAMVEKFRMPYSGYIYPDKSGGTERVLRKYDRAFHRGRSLASSFERRDIALHKQAETRRGPLGFFRRTVRETPHWAGHCNGWTAAAIRHAEPQKNVVRNGVVFTPADIKGLLAELYVYSDSEFLGGVNRAINPATFHVVLANWLGRGGHPVGMDTTLGREVWNYPIYAYTSSFAKRGDRQVEVKVNIGYVYSVNREYDRAPENFKFKYFHYMLDLNEKGEIIGGSYYRDSSHIDMLWAALKPTQGGQEGNKEGNPYVDAKEVLAMWRESVPEDLRNKWYNIDPPEEDRILDPAEEAELAEADEESAAEQTDSETDSDDGASDAATGESADAASNQDGDTSS